MTGTRYRRGGMYAADMARYARSIAEDNSAQLLTVRQNLTRAIQEEVTPRQRQMLFLYYSEGYTMQEIGDMLEVDKSTVSRTIKRGEARLRRCLRFGADRLLSPEL